MEENENVDQSGTTQEPEYVTIDEATDEELDAFLAGETEAELEPQTADEEYQAAENTQEDSGEPQESEEEAAPTETPEERAQRLEAQNEELQERLEQQELFIKRRNSELGELRRQLQDQAKTLREEAKELDGIDSDQAYAKRKEADQLEAEAEKAKSEVEAQSRVHEAQLLFAQHLRPNEMDLPAMVETLRRDGTDERVVKAFEQNPWVLARPETLIHLQKRANAERMLIKTVEYAKQLIEENKKLKGKPRDVLNKIQRASSASQSLTAASGGAAQRGELSQKSFDKMTDSELDEYLKASGLRM